MYGSSVTGLPSGARTENRSGASRPATSAVSPRSQLMCDPSSKSPSFSVLRLPFPVNQASSASVGRQVPVVPANETVSVSVSAKPLSRVMSAYTR